MKAIWFLDIKKNVILQHERYIKVKKQRGMTLLEIIIVLGIIGTISAGVVVLAQRAFDSKAMADLVTNTNIVSTAMKETYGTQGVFPGLESTAAMALTDATVGNTPLTPMGKLVALGRLSTAELKNPISGNYFNVGGANIGTNANRGYVIMVNGLNQKQCRNVLLQMANQWEFVEVRDNMASGTYPTGVVTLTNAAVSMVDADGNAQSLPNAGIFRSMAVNGNNTITADSVTTACTDSSTNGIILGSR